MNNDNLQTPCNSCGRPMQYCSCSGGCNKCGDIKFSEYGCKHNACIRNKQPECPYTAVIPSVTVEDISNIKDLADCFVHVSKINTTFYIDDKHRITSVWQGPVEVGNYDIEENPLNLRSQFLFDYETGYVVYFNAQGKPMNLNDIDTIVERLEPELQEKINNKLNQMAEDGTLAEIIAEYAVEKVDYYKITTDLSEDDIIEIINKTGRAKVIEFEDGDYLFTKHLHLKSNTTFILNNANILTETGKIIFSYEFSDTYTGYDGEHDIKIIGGNINMPIALMHNKNVVFESVNFLSTLSTHAIQFGGCNGVEIRNCKFNGMLTNDTNVGVSEMVQFETCIFVGQPWSPSTSPMFDHTGVENVLIEGCYFKEANNTSSKLYGCIGHHARDEENPLFAKNVVIRNCTFEQTIYSTITAFGMINSTIENCIFNQTNYYNDHSTIRVRGNNKDLIIRNNIFNGYSVAISTANLNQNDGIKVIGNTFNSDTMTSIGAIYANAWKNSKFENNVFNFNGGNAISLVCTNDSFESTENYIANNKFVQLNSSSTSCINTTKSSSLTVVDNEFKQINTTCPFIYYRATTVEDTKPMMLSNNVVLTATNFAPVIVTVNGTANRRYFYGFKTVCYSHGSAYETLTNKALSTSFRDFSNMEIQLAKAGDGSKLHSFDITPYGAYARFSEDQARTYNFIANVAGSPAYATLELHTDGTISYSSTNNALTLTAIRCYNK